MSVIISMNSAVVIFSLVLVWLCSGQPSLGDPQRSLILHRALESLRADNSTNGTSSTNETSADVPSDIPGNGTRSSSILGNDTSAAQNHSTFAGTLRAIIGFFASRGHNLGLDVNKKSPDSTAQTTQRLPVDNLGFSRFVERLLNLNVNENITESENSTALTTDKTDLLATDSTTQLQTTPGLPETPGRQHTHEVERSSVSHRPDLELPHGVSTHTVSGSSGGEETQQPNPSTEKVEEPVDPSPDENLEHGSLPLVLGAAIVVIFGVGVAGAAISSACRRRRMAKDTVSEGSGSDIEVERGIDNPMFSNKSTSNLNLVARAFPPNSRLYKEMRLTTPTLPLY